MAKPTALSIKDVDFGRIDAESDDNLFNYFVDTGVMKKIQAGQKQFIMGRKGSGKTALFKQTTKERLGREIVSLDFKDYPWELHKMVREAGLSPESAYLASWRFTFLAAACRHWMKNGPKALRKPAAALMARIYKDEDPGVLEVLFDKFRRFRKFELPEAGPLKGGGIELDEKEQGPILAQSVNQWCRVLDAFVKEHFDEAPFTIKLDGLDDGWDASEESKLLLAGVLKAARDINLKLRSPGKPVAVLTFLRSDIYNELRFNDKNKLRDDIESLEWPDEKLMEVVARRISASLGVKDDEAWTTVFTSEPMRQGTRVHSYILKRSLGRPRDVIAFCQECRNVATEHGHDVVDRKDVYAAEDRYSKHIYDELDDEMGKQVPGNREYLQILRALAKTRFTFQEWLDACRRRDPKVDETVAKESLKILFDYSIVGVPRTGGFGGGSTFQYSFHDRLVEPNFDSEVIIHPALKKVLQLKDTRRSADEITGVEFPAFYNVVEFLDGDDDEGL